MITMTPYVVEYHDGIGPSGYGPDEPRQDNTVTSLADARRLFWQMARDDYRHNVPTDQGGPHAVVHYADAWDGISYGDTRFAHIKIGPRGGLSVEWSW